MLAHNCAVLGIPVDTYRLFTADEPYYEMWLTMVVDKVNETNRRQMKK